MVIDEDGECVRHMRTRSTHYAPAIPSAARSGLVSGAGVGEAPGLKPRPIGRRRFAAIWVPAVWLPGPELAFQDAAPSAYAQPPQSNFPEGRSMVAGAL